MRKDSKKEKEIKVNGIQRYHNGNYYTETYAQEGFATEFKVFNSDRCIEPSQTIKSFGVEFELVSNTIVSNYAFGAIIEKAIYPQFPKGLFKQQSDSSLRGDSSSELITQPMTKSFIRNHYNDFKAMFDFLKTIDSLPNDSCGQHVNISLACFGKTAEQQKKAIMRLHNWMCDNYNTACALFKRSTRHTTYCGCMRRDYINTSNDHHAMCNYSHMNAGTASRIEIRLVGPQKSFISFRNTMEVIFHLVESAKDGKDFSNPVKLWSGCNECVLSRLSDIIGNGITREQFEEIKAKSINSGIKEATTHR